MSEARTRILDAARALFLSGGAGAVTMRSVAERVGVTATALYRHFENKDELLGEVINAGFRGFGGYLYRALQGATPQERLQRSGQAYLDFALEQPEMYRTIFMSTRPAEACTAREPSMDATFRFLVDRVRECIQQGALRQDEPEDVALFIWAHVHGLVSLYLTGASGQTEQEFRETYRRSVERLFSGLSP
ncbi:MAG: TetR/AcrR family transcriptional regulator [Myxococcaceae bacterium]|nr:TetR/AcrR family transcriptional regulator [Myxococcaceae bacterium]MCI0670181.1 TetR/AcrR family transcriptional regulator [Myxococcaceae bacterium]